LILVYLEKVFHILRPVYFIKNKQVGKADVFAENNDFKPFSKKISAAGA